MLSLHRATPSELAWAQAQVQAHHYLHTPVDSRCSPLAYVARLGTSLVGCLIFGRPEATRCYSGGLTYGSYEDVQQGRCQFDRWEVINLARVWLDPAIQRDGLGYVPRAASTLIKAALDRVGYDYLAHRPPVDCSRPYQIRVCLSYCDTRVHTGYLYRVCRFKLARQNIQGIQTFWRTVAPLTTVQDTTIRTLAEQSQRSRQIRSARRERSKQHKLSL
jgi:hypothetical protein